MKELKKIVVAFIVMAVFVTVTLYETYSIIKKEYERQVETYSTVREDINLNLNMIKIAVQTTDEETFKTNLEKMKAESERLNELSFLNNQMSGYRTRLSYYLELLESKKDLFPEIKELKAKVDEVTSSVKESFKSSGITRDKVRELNSKFNKLKFKTDGFTNERVKIVADVVNAFLDEMADGGKTLSDCIDTCYKNRISEINDNLSNSIKAFSDKTGKLNRDIEKEFDLNTLTDLQ